MCKILQKALKAKVSTNIFDYTLKTADHKKKIICICLKICYLHTAHFVKMLISLNRVTVENVPYNANKTKIKLRRINLQKKFIKYFNL